MQTFYKANNQQSGIIKLPQFFGIIAARSCWQGKQHSKTKQTNLDSPSFQDAANRHPRQQYQVCRSAVEAWQIYDLPSRCHNFKAQMKAGANSEVSCCIFLQPKKRGRNLHENFAFSIYFAEGFNCNYSRKLK